MGPLSTLNNKITPDVLKIRMKSTTKILKSSKGPSTTTNTTCGNVTIELAAQKKKTMCVLLR